jgi:hypothetical protein
MDVGTVGYFLKKHPGRSYFVKEEKRTMKPF